MPPCPTVTTGAPQSGRLRVSEDCPSVVVRLMDSSRQGQVEVAAGTGGMRDLLIPSYISAAPMLGPKFLATMRKATKNKTYAKVGQWLAGAGAPNPSQSWLGLCRLCC